ncbi:GNAT family N-acetyltransferase [Bifidobacterium gallicum]|nr:GNAT family N-acetyltransferase [Bifidobacterium gallicum]KFI58896.1 acetyltransferase, GNAT family [Bifidobacterium gallicum DSM 20093 = LMG 11596]
MTTNTDTVTFRLLERDDYPALIELVREAWYSDVSDEQIARDLAELDFERSLARATTAQVAVRNGIAVGLILGRIDTKETRPLVNTHHTNVVRLETQLMRSAEGRKQLAQLHRMFREQRKLLKLAKDSGNAYDGEIIMFLIDPALRGKGIGKRLFDWMLGEFKAAGVLNYFLWTDTTSDYGFYDHQGMNLAGEQQPMPQRSTENMKLDQHLRVLMYDNETDFANEGVNPLGRD